MSMYIAHCRKEPLMLCLQMNWWSLLFHALWYWRASLSRYDVS